MSLPLLETRQISKSFGVTRALNGVSLALFAGEVVAVVGENGAGKSTLMKILAGIEAPDDGTILQSGSKVTEHSVRNALARGIALIHQELNLCSNLTIAENIFLGREPVRYGFVDTKRLTVEAKAILERVGLPFDPRTIVGELSLAQRQQVEIARALSLDARVIIFDEPTSSLTQRETQKLFGLIRELRTRGLGILYISHRLAEVREIAQRVIVLRDGENAGSLTGREVTHEALISLMVGRKLEEAYPHAPRPLGNIMLEVEGMVSGPFSKPVSLAVRKGEVVGIAGLVGAGRTELLQALFGIRAFTRGAVRVDGKSFLSAGPAAAIAAGLGLVPESRKEEGLLMTSSIAENVSLAAMRKERRVFLSRYRDDLAGARALQELSIKAESASKIVSALSGGNQQKVVVAKWLATFPKVLLLDEPTRGIDVGAKREMYELLFALAGEGLSILFVSSDMEELLGIADRIYVMHEGEITGELQRSEFSEEAVMRLATGSRSVGEASNGSV